MKKESKKNGRIKTIPGGSIWTSRNWMTEMVTPENR